VTAVTVEREQLVRGELPPICVVTGGPADGTVTCRLESLPTWTWILLLFGVVPFLVALLFAQERIEGQVPVVREVVTRFHLLRKRAALLAAGAFLALIVAIPGPTIPALVVSAGVMATALATGLWARWRFIHGRPVGDRRVRLSGVHPDFAAAVRAATPEHPAG
jgi:hypothetical protein